jgi:hypothetical protein
MKYNLIILGTDSQILEQTPEIWKKEALIIVKQLSSY